MDDADRSDPGEITALIELISEHPDEFTYDWRTRFGLPLAAIFDGRMSWDEAYALTRELSRDQTSHVGAALNGWSYARSPEALVLMDLYDLTMAANTDKNKRSQVKPYPRPWKRTATRSKRPTVDQSTIRAALAARGH